MYYMLLALRDRHRARPSAPAHHAVSATTIPQLVVYSYWKLQGKVCPPPGQINPPGGAQLGILPLPHLGQINPLGWVPCSMSQLTWTSHP